MLEFWGWSSEHKHHLASRGPVTKAAFERVAPTDDRTSSPVREDATSFEIRTMGLTKPAYASRSARSRPQSARLATTSKQEQKELEELQDLFSGSRESPIAAGVYARYKQSLDNLAKAGRAREERRQRDALRLQIAEQQYQVSQERRAKVRGRNERARRDMITQNLERGEMIRQQRMILNEQLGQQRDALHAIVRAKVEEGKGGFNSLDSRLDAQEEAAAAAVREVHAQERQERHLEARRLKRQQSAQLKVQAESLREQTAARLKEAIEERSRSRADMAEEKRAEHARRQLLLKESEEERLRKVAKTKARSQTIRANAGRARQELARAKQEEIAKQERLSQERIAKAKECMLRENQEKRRAIFSSRFVSREEAQGFAGSTFQKLYTMDDVADAEIDAANADILERITSVQQRTDDLIDDDAAGEVRSRFEAESKARKEAEEARIARDNEEMLARILNKQAVTDCVLDDEAAATRREEMAAESKARKLEERRMLVRKNLEMQARLANVKPSTDDDITDELAGEARVRERAASKAWKETEAARLKKANIDHRNKLARTSARTDDDIMDEEAGAARSKLAVHSKQRRAAEAARTTRQNNEMENRIKSVKAVVDDDIDDDIAGKARSNYDTHHRGWFGFSSSVE